MDQNKDVAELIRIGPVGRTDGERLGEFFDGLSERTRAVFGPHYRFDREHAEQIAQGGQGDRSKKYFVAVHETAGDRAGSAPLVGLTWFWHWTCKVPWFGIMIADAYQNRGLGQKMLQTMMAEAERSGKGGILLTTAKTNVRAQELYKRNGFNALGHSDNGEILMILNFADHSVD